MKETPRRIKVTSSSAEISKDHPGTKVGEIGGGGANPFYSRGQIFKDDVTVFLPSQIFAS
jgi:hypothetical protein